jgi:hypothetical protein
MDGIDAGTCASGVCRRVWAKQQSTFMYSVLASSANAYQRNVALRALEDDAFIWYRVWRFHCDGNIVGVPNMLRNAEHGGCGGAYWRQAVCMAFSHYAAGLDITPCRIACAPAGCVNRQTT